MAICSRIFLLPLFCFLVAVPAYAQDEGDGDAAESDATANDSTDVDGGEGDTTTAATDDEVDPRLHPPISDETRAELRPAEVDDHCFNISYSGGTLRQAGEFALEMRAECEQIVEESWFQNLNVVVEEFVLLANAVVALNHDMNLESLVIGMPPGDAAFLDLLRNRADVAVYTVDEWNGRAEQAMENQGYIDTVHYRTHVLFDNWVIIMPASGAPRPADVAATE